MKKSPEAIFDEVEIKEEKIEEDPFSFMRKSATDIHVENENFLRSRRALSEYQPMTKIPKQIDYPHLPTIDEFKHMIKSEPVDNDATFEEIQKEKSSGGGTKRKRRNEKPTANKKMKKEVQKCPQCDYQNLLKCVMTRHIKLHSQQGVIKCKKCYVLCANLKNMNIHMKRSH